GAVWLLLALSPPVAAQTGEVVGVVRTAAGATVVDAAVQLRPAEVAKLAGVAETNAQGRFRFTGLTAGGYHLSVQRLGYAALDTAFVLGAVPLSLSLVLQERAIGLPGVRVEAERARARFDEIAGVTAVGLRRDELKLLPGLA